ncbi:stage III sporulation protein AC [Clostridium grantii]|uniref:Stage III sporulation protein AC n=1 Tax=Clostridium grantii DSM 8605 TaxID=1121316 RepID=A0A1M5SFM6_9CLOT|nr:stage III sporulation protein AC [Clostridium grantii]SHH37291.1 stage III sporulation protein AC [Clostridium grantii DSM 8605]
MLETSLIFKLAGISLLIIVLDKIIRSSGGKEDYAVVINIAGIVIILMMVLGLINNLFNTIKTMFSF